MFLTRSKDDKSQGGEGEGEGEAPSVDLTMAVPTSQQRSLGVTRSLSEVAQVADPSSSQTGSLRNFDMNRLPTGTDEEGDGEGEGEGEGDGEGGGGSSSAVSIVSPFLSPRNGEADRAEIQENHNNSNKNTLALRSNTSDHEDEEGAAHGGGGGAPPRKKLRLSKEQSALLEESFREHHTLNPKQKNALAKQLNLKSRQVEVWFQNRRARTKLKQTEVDCEFLKRCCESLTEENRRLQREVEELRAIKVAPPCVIAQDFYMPLPAATLTMCPSCERMGSTIDKRALTFVKPSYHVTNFRQPSAAC